MRIEIRVGRTGLRRWHLRLMERLRLDPARPEVKLALVAGEGRVARPGRRACCGSNASCCAGGARRCSTGCGSPTMRCPAGGMWPPTR